MSKMIRLNSTLKKVSSFMLENFEISSCSENDLRAECKSGTTTAKFVNRQLCSLNEGVVSMNKMTKLNINYFTKIATTQTKTITTRSYAGKKALSFTGVIKKIVAFR